MKAIITSDDASWFEMAHEDALPGGKEAVRAADCVVTDRDGERLHMQLTLLEGKYHQVKRMLAAVGNRVEALHRSRVGDLALPADLLPGQWRWLSASDLEKLKPR